MKTKIDKLAESIGEYIGICVGICIWFILAAVLWCGLQWAWGVFVS